MRKFCAIRFVGGGKGTLNDEGRIYAGFHIQGRLNVGPISQYIVDDCGDTMVWGAINLGGGKEEAGRGSVMPFSFGRGFAVERIPTLSKLLPVKRRYTHRTALTKIVPGGAALEG